LGLGIALCAEPFVLTFFTNRWVEAIPVMRAIALYALLLSLTYNAGDVYKAQGRPDILTKQDVLRMALLAPALWWAVTVPVTITAVGWVQAGAALIAAIMFLVVAVKMLDASLWVIVEALRPAAFSGALMIPAVLGMLALTASAAPIVQLIASVLAGAVVYLGTLWLFQRELMFQTGQMLLTVMARR
jgi:O-antigen/teichoic acid export membrane protein